MEQFKTDNISVRGYSHELIGKECQDNSVSWQTNNYTGIIVCDGHGGDKYIRSAVGSALACRVGKELIERFMSSVIEKKISLNENNYEDILMRLERAIIQNWREEAEKDYSAFPIENDERFGLLNDAEKQSLRKNTIKAYGTTFIAAVMAKDFCFIIKLGDGNANLLLPDSAVVFPKELQDDELQFNVTTSMCNSDADMMFRRYYCAFNDRKRIVGILLTSDGIINCYRSEDSYKSLVKNIFYSYSEQQRKEAHDELEDLLHTLSRKGSGDDLSVALVFDKKSIRVK